MMLFGRLALITAAASFSLAPTSAIAKTRASDSAPSYAVEPAASGAEDEDDERALYALLDVVMASAFLAGLIVIIDDNQNQSPGAN
ncbi:MAG: hypothetical protein AAF553_08285 [Pseudomonadota bacterium]